MYESMLFKYRSPYKNLPLSEINTSNEKYSDLSMSITNAQLKRLMSSEDLAAKVGITPKHLDDIKMNRALPTLDLLIKICIALNAHIVITPEDGF